MTYLIAVVVDNDPRRTRDVAVQGALPGRPAGCIGSCTLMPGWSLCVRVVRAEHGNHYPHGHWH